jgi:hypothetical protein
MFRSTAVVVALSILPWLQPSHGPVSAAAAPGCVDVFPHHPIVVYEISGGTLAGPLDQELLVYGDGSARLSSSTANFGAGSSQLTFVGDAAAAALITSLSQNGAFQLCDVPDQVSDMPLSTLTVMRGNTDSRVHTYSWFLAPQGQHATVEQILQSFISAHF